MKTSDLTGDALNRAVHTALQYEAIHKDCTAPPYSSDWAHGGPIIEREAIQLTPDEYTGTWAAFTTREGEPYDYTGPTPLIAAMRCYVASKLGDEVAIPNELTGDNK